jgi:hypothetical protein
VSNKTIIFGFLAVSSLLYSLEALGAFGLTGVGFELNFSRLASVWPFALFAAPLYLFSGYPPVWALLYVGLRLAPQPINKIMQNALAFARITSLLVAIAVLGSWILKSLIEPFAWSRVLLATLMLTLPIATEGNRRTKKLFSKSKLAKSGE